MKQAFPVRVARCFVEEVVLIEDTLNVLREFDVRDQFSYNIYYVKYSIMTLYPPVDLIETPRTPVGCFHQS